MAFCTTTLKIGFEICRISSTTTTFKNIYQIRFEHQDGRLNIYSFSFYEPHDFLTNVYFLMTFY